MKLVFVSVLRVIFILQGLNLQIPSHSIRLKIIDPCFLCIGAMMAESCNNYESVMVVRLIFFQIFRQISSNKILSTAESSKTVLSYCINFTFGLFIGHLITQRSQKMTNSLMFFGIQTHFPRKLSHPFPS